MTYELNRVVPLPSLSDETIAQVFNAAKQTVEIPETLHFSIAIVTDDEIHQMNKVYRQKDKPTDVLSFRYDDQNGEIVISADRVRAQAKEYEHTEETESAFLLVHGILHIIGWDHERSEKEANDMRALEINILQQCGLKYAR